jgi:pimeloyl-ACP methyl ester carboxylesterase
MTEGGGPVDADADEPTEGVRPAGSTAQQSFGRRALLVGGVGLGVVALGAAGVASGIVPVPSRIRRAFQDTGVDGTIPPFAAGAIALEQRTSTARGQQVGFFTAVPAGYGDGKGLPVCLILHGASATTASYEAFGFGQFLTAAVDSGVPPFVLAGADGGRTFWAGNGTTDDPQRMLHDELPSWCDERGFDTSRMAAYGWSMGGHGTLLAAERHPGWLRAAAALSPAVAPGDEVFDGAGALVGARTGIWCGTADALYPSVQKLVAVVPGGPAIAAFSPGAHTRGFWNRITPDAFAFVGSALTPAA